MPSPLFTDPRDNVGVDLTQGPSWNAISGLLPRQGYRDVSTFELAAKSGLHSPSSHTYMRQRVSQLIRVGLLVEKRPRHANRVNIAFTDLGRSCAEVYGMTPATPAPVGTVSSPAFDIVSFAAALNDVIEQATAPAPAPAAAECTHGDELKNGRAALEWMRSHGFALPR